MTLHRKLTTALSAGLATAILIAGSGTAMAASAEQVAKITHYSGSDRQAFLEAGARKEGKLLIYAVGTQIRPVMEAFKKKYPFIEYQLFRAGSTKITRKTLEEYRAGYHKVDVFELNETALAPIRDAGYLASFDSPQLANYPSHAIEAKKHWAVVRESYLSLGYNTTKVSPAEAPHTLDDLLDPKWKGKMALSGRSSTLGNWVGTLVMAKGKDFVRKLGKQDIRVYQTSGRALANLIVSGEVALSPTIYNSHVYASRRKGGKIAWRALGPTYVVVTATAIAQQANSPHAAMLLVDFLLSKQGQKIYGKLGYASARKDMPMKAGPAQKVYMNNRPNYAREFESWTKLANRVFVRRH